MKHFWKILTALLLLVIVFMQYRYHKKVTSILEYMGANCDCDFEDGWEEEETTE